MRSVPLVGDVAAGTDVLAQENVEELLPLPADFVGDGDLFMLRVRGDSMIEAGILDGDYVVARNQPTAENGDIVVAGIPGEEATVKTYRAKGAKVTLVPANPRLEPMVFDAAGRHGLRPGGHGAAAALTADHRRAAPDLTAARGSSLRTRARRSGEGRQCQVGALDRLAGDPLVRGVGEGGVARAEVGGRDAVRGEASDVGPAELGANGQLVACHERGQQRMVEAGAAPSATSDHLDHVAVLDPRRAQLPHVGLGLGGCAVGREAVVHEQHDLVGHHVPGDAALDADACSASRYSQPSITGRRSW